MEIDSIVVHVGFNDIMKGSSEQLDFKELIDSLLDTNERPIISGLLLHEAEQVNPRADSDEETGNQGNQGIY
jgi:hypothetical protein